MIIPYGEYLPDMPALENPGATVASNVMPAAKGYRPLRDMSAITSVMDAYGRGGIAVRDKDGNVSIYLGNASKLYRAASPALSDVSKVGGYTTGADERWEFVKWGEAVIATNFTDAVQKSTIGAAAFADLAGTPPKARHIGVVRDFVVLGNVFDASDGNVPHRVQWSAINNSDSWATSATTQADRQDIQDGGWVRAIVGGEYGVVFMEKQIVRMTYVGSPVIFQFDVVETGRGTAIPGSVVKLGANIFYWSADGFYVLANGASSQGIGSNKVDRTFTNDLDADNYQRVSSAIDPINKLVVWSYPSVNSNGTPDKLAIFHWPTGRWSSANVTSQIVLSGQAFGYTMEGLDALTTNMDTFTLSLDSKSLAGGALALMGVTSLNALGGFDGSYLEAVLETPEVELSSRRAFLRSVRPLTDGASSSVVVRHRSRLADSPTNSSASAGNDIGECPTRISSRYFRIRETISGGFTDAQGVSLDVVAEGAR